MAQGRWNNGDCGKTQGATDWQIAGSGRTRLTGFMATGEIFHASDGGFISSCTAEMNVARVENDACSRVEATPMESRLDCS